MHSQVTVRNRRLSEWLFAQGIYKNVRVICAKDEQKKFRNDKPPEYGGDTLDIREMEAGQKCTSLIDTGCVIITL